MVSGRGFLTLGRHRHGKTVDRILLAKYSPAAVLVDEGLEVLEIRALHSVSELAGGPDEFPPVKLIPDTGLSWKLRNWFVRRQRAENPRAVHAYFTNRAEVSAK
jgi:hypothetical protein